MTLDTVFWLLLLLYPAALLCLGVYDLVVVLQYWNAPKWPTFTQKIIAFSKAYPAFPYLIGLTQGLLCAHLFLQF